MPFAAGAPARYLRAAAVAAGASRRLTSTVAGTAAQGAEMALPLWPLALFAGTCTAAATAGLTTAGVHVVFQRHRDDMKRHMDGLQLRIDAELARSLAAKEAAMDEFERMFGRRPA